MKNNYRLPNIAASVDSQALFTIGKRNSTFISASVFCETLYILCHLKATSEILLSKPVPVTNG
jgi:hypothetical protein